MELAIVKEIKQRLKLSKAELKSHTKLLEQKISEIKQKKAELKLLNKQYSSLGGENLLLRMTVFSIKKELKRTKI